MIHEFKDLIKDFQNIITLIPFVVSSIYLIIHIYNLYTKNIFESLFESKFIQVRDAIIQYLSTSVFIISLIGLCFINNPFEEPNVLTHIMISVLGKPILYVILVVIFQMISWISILYISDFNGRFNRKILLKMNKISWKNLKIGRKISVIIIFFISLIMMIIFSGFPIGVSISLLISPNVVKTTSQINDLYFTILIFTTTFLILFYPTYKVFKTMFFANIITTIYTEDEEFIGEVLYVSKNKMVVMLIKSEDSEYETILIPLDRVVLAKGKMTKIDSR